MSAPAPPIGTKWTPAQWAGISTCGKSLLVSAAAGSGKTAVLAERCVHLVCDGDHPCDVDQLLVVTFTEATAAEMKSRIADALRKRIATSDDRRLRRQLLLLDQAQINTMHGFCSHLLRQHFHLLKLDPKFRVLDADEAKLMRRETARTFFAERFEAADAARFTHLLDSHAGGNDETILGRVEAAYELLRSLKDPAAWMQTALHRLRDGAAKPLASSELGRELLDLAGAQLDDLLDRCRQAYRSLAHLNGFQGYLSLLELIGREVKKWRQTLTQSGWDALVQAVTNFNLPRKPSIPNSTPGKAEAVALLDPILASIKDEDGLRGMLIFTEAEWRDGLSRTLADAEEFIRLVREYGERYTDAKRRAGGIDFSDMEQLALQLLREGDKPSAVALQCHDLYGHVLVDEYQDINELQDAILNLVSHECDGKRPGNLFCVGDVKQSIYRFRLAEPRRFLDRSAAFRQDGALGTVIDLQANFRSRGPLLEALNALFFRLMSQRSAEIEYDQSHHLHPAATFGDIPADLAFTGAPVELHVLPDTRSLRGQADEEETEETPGDPCDGDTELDEFDATEREAAFVAQRIGQMVGRMRIAQRDGTHRPLRYRDVVILLRTMQVKSDQLAAAMTAVGIPSHRESGTGFFASMEIRDLLAVLNVMDNGRQDIALASVLRGPLLGLPQAEENLARIRLAYRQAPGSRRALPFHLAVSQYAAEQRDELAQQLRQRLATLEEWRQMAQQRPLPEVLRAIYDQTGYLCYVAGLTQGQQRVANLLALQERATQFAAFARQSLWRFLEFLKQLQDESDLGQPSVLGEAEDLVRIMSVHRSKGLEFPVVFLPDLGKKINTQDTYGSILFDRQKFLGLDAVDEQRRIRWPSLASVLVERHLHRQVMAEEMRVLYVAMTRARECLMLVGTARDGAAGRWQAAYPDGAARRNAEAVLRCGNMLEWIGPVAQALPSQFTVAFHDAATVASWLTPLKRQRGLDPDAQRLAGLHPLAAPPPHDPRVDALVARLTRTYAHAAATTRLAVRAATDLAQERKALPPEQMHEHPPDLGLPRFAAAEPLGDGADIGTATHLALQHLDLSRPCDARDLDGQLQRLVEHRLLGPQQVKLVDIAALDWFFKSPLGRLALAGADGVRREWAFHLAYGDGPDPLDAAMVRGQVDLMIPTPRGLVLVDYKTDRVSADGLQARAAGYEPQVKIYGDAIEGILGVPVAEAWLVFLSAREAVQVQSPCDENK